MATKIRLQIDPVDRIPLKRNLNKSGKGLRFFTHEVRRLSDPYVPFLNGKLSEEVTESPGSITYNVPYARRQYYENMGKTGVNIRLQVATGQSVCGRTVEKRLLKQQRRIAEERRDECSR